MGACLTEESGHLRFKQGKAHFSLILTSGSALSPGPAGGGPPDGVERHRVLVTFGHKIQDV